MKTDIEIAQSTPIIPIQKIAESIGISNEQVIPYGNDKAKISYQLIDDSKVKQSNLILVTAITPTKAGIGKTTTSIALAQGLKKIGKKSILALREPSLGPCFGMKGGACGGGYSQVIPMEDINLHFTGDFHAITSANNMIAALVDNFQYYNKTKPNGLKQILWKRVLDVNDRALRNVITSLQGNGQPTETGFDITPASEIMAILCLAKNMEDLRARIGNILVGYTNENKACYLKDLGFEGAICTLLKDAINPNLVQTLEGGAAFIHGGPFANIAHGCNSIVATKLAMTYGDYVITEAGFGADLGAEKFLNIKCRIAEISPKVTVLVVTSQALKLHGNVNEKEIAQPNLEGLKSGLKNLERHIENLQGFGQSVVVAFNRYGFDSDEEINFISNWCKEKGAEFALNDGFMNGGKGAADLAKKVIDIIENKPSSAIKHTYDLTDSIEEKINKIVSKIYKGKTVHITHKAQLILKKIKELGLEHYPVCIAKTQYSFSDDAKKVGAVSDFEIEIENLVINNGAGFIVAVAGEIMRMPGLPKEPQALHIDIVNDKIVGLS
ncbi:MAG: formate--tetrahydrofolate ligase [Bacteroidota bacterium]